MAGFKTLFLIDDIIADETLDEKRQPLLELAISGRHKNHSLWLLTQSYTAVPKNIRRQAKMLYVWCPKNRMDLNIIHEENDVIETPEELGNVKKQLKQGKHTCLREWSIQELTRFIEFCNKTVTRLLSRDYSTSIKRLHHSYQEITALLSRDYSTPMKRLQHSCQKITALLSRDYSTAVKRLQHCCQEITALLSRDYSTPVKRLQHSYQEINALLSKDYSTPVKRLQHCCQEITALLSRDYSTPVKRLQHSCQEITALLSAKHNKMTEYLNFFLLCTLLALILYLYIQIKTLFKNGRREYH